MAVFTRTNGTAGAVGTLNGTSGAQVGQSVKLYLVTVKNGSASAQDIRGEDDAVNEVFEVILKQFPSLLAYYAANASSGVISIITDGHSAPAASVLQTAIQALGTVNSMDISGTTVADGVSFTVA